MSDRSNRRVATGEGIFGVETSRIENLLSEDAGRSRVFGPGYEEIVAPTSDPTGRSRALKCGYNWSTQTLVIIFRDMTWVQYDGVDDHMWEALWKAYSTNTYVNTFLAGWPWSETSYGQLPRTKPDNFRQGRID